MPEIEQAFPEMKDAERQALLSLATTRSFVSGDSIITQGSIHEQLYVIRRGNARILQQGFDQANVEFTGPLGPGDLFGEMSFLDGNKASATLIADGDVEVYQFNNDDVSALLEKDTEMGMRFYRSLLKTMCRRLRATNIRVTPAS
jgi:extracellular factor (EF) 3-hydroxypalmitic acid methyl ester biosynthesis protein